jgi:hypothetical protein
MGALMDQNSSVCGAATIASSPRWPEGWLAGQAPERRPARVAPPRPLIVAIVDRRHVRVRAVRGWREPFAEPAQRGDGEGFGRGASSPMPCERCEGAEAATRIRAALDTLPGRYRQALHLVYVEGRTHGETAAHLAVPLGTAKAWVRRGLHALRVAHASLSATPTSGVANASRRLSGLRLESCRASRVSREVTATLG